MTTVSIDQTELCGQGAAESERINESAEKQKSSVEFAAFGVSGSLTALTAAVLLQFSNCPLVLWDGIHHYSLYSL